MSIKHLHRDPTWYSKWMFEDGGFRREVLEQLCQAIAKRNLDDQTAAELQQLLDYEYLSIQYPRTQASLYHGAPGQCTTEGWSAKLLDQISQCVTQPISAPSPVEKEILFRTLLSTINLIRAQGVTQDPNMHHRQLYSRFEYELRNLQLQECKITTELTSDYFRTVQCSYLLHVALDYAQLLIPPLPELISHILEQWITCAFNVAFAGTGLNTQRQAAAFLQSLEEELRNFWWQPKGKLQTLLAFQEFSRVAVTLHLIGTVSNQPRPPNTHIMLQNAQGFAKIVLERLSHVISQDEQIEFPVQPLPLQTLANATLSSLNAYTYFYGMLDCARLLSKVIERDSLPLALQVVMTKIIAEAKDPRFRWKAIEIRISNASDQEHCSKSIVSSVSEGCSFRTKQPLPQLREEILKISQFIMQEQGHYSQQRRNSNVVSISSGLTPNDGPKYRLMLHSWIENSIQPTQWSSERQTVLAELERPLRALKMPRFFKGLIPRVECISAGLSPHCEAAFLLRRSCLMLYDVRSLTDGAVIRQGIEIPSPRGHMREAILSDTFVAFIYDSSLHVHEYAFPLRTQKVGKEHVFEQEAGHQWDPTCVAIHEDRHRAWVAVGGGINCGEDIYGDIKVFHIDKLASNKTILPQIALFRRSHADPLAGGPVKGLSFGPDRRKLVCITNNNHILVWTLSNNSKPCGNPFKIEKFYHPETTADGVTSATIFSAPSMRPYIFTTTSPSFQRAAGGLYGEWSYISPVAPCSTEVPEVMVHNITELRKKILVGAVTANGGLVAVLEKSGKIKVLSLTKGSPCGISCEKEVNEVHGVQLCSSMEKASSTSLRFEETDRGLFIMAVDTNGKLARHKWTGLPMKSTLPEIPGLPVELSSIEFISSTPELPTSEIWELA
ncbi:hypothetical protein AOQ84DRAFT_40036 [Glonium stellatum]|uniref:Uncharacterized protein n=1 Tax=Glonium stellatum TaxID=574774 RepID=A0A8E2JT23_9PEZI|nr:hypothetical protein AOQ84DRAFT_40036 [Glonium stellatum]